MAVIPEKRKPAGPGDVAAGPSSTPATHEAVNVGFGQRIAAVAAAARSPRQRQGLNPSDIQRLVARLRNGEEWGRIKASTVEIDPDVLEAWRVRLFQIAENPQGVRRMPGDG